MIPCELILRNFMCYREDLPPLCLDGLHIACLSGENGAGKSALLDAITWAIWGKARMNDDDLIAQGASEMLVDLRFQLDGQRYRVIRQRKRGKSGTRSSGKSTLDFQMQGEMGWRPIGDGKIIETEKSIENVLRMKYDTFINASMLLQGRADEFTRKNPAERKQVLADILDLGEYATLEGRAKERVKKLHDEIKGLEGIIGHLQQEAGKLDIYARLVSEAEAKAATLTAELETAEATRQEADAQVQALEVKQERRKQVTQELTKLGEEQQQQEQEIAGLRRQISAAEALLGRQDAIHAGMEALRTAQNELKRLEGLRPRFDQLREQRGQLQDELKEEKRNLQRKLDQIKYDLQELQRRAARRPAAQTELADLEQRLAALSPLSEKLQAVRAGIDDCDQRIAQANTLLVRRGELVSAIKLRQDSLVSVREEQQRISESRARDLRDRDRWQADLEGALVQQQTRNELTAQLVVLREQEQAGSIRVGELRAQCTQFKQQADQIKKDRDRLSSADTTICPVCRSELGDTGIAGVLEHYDQEVTDLRERYRTGQREAKALEAKLTQTRTQVQTRNDQLLQAQSGAARVPALQENLANARAWQAELDQARITLADVQRQLDAEDYAPEARTELQEVDQALTALAPSLQNKEQRTKNKEQGTRGQADQPGDIGAQVLDALKRERAALQQQQADLEQQLTAQTSLLSGIETCHRELADLDQVLVDLPQVEAQATALADQIERNDFAHETRVAGRTIEADIAALGYSIEAHNAAGAEVERLTHWADEERNLYTAKIQLDSDRKMLQQAGELLKRRTEDIEQLTREDALLEQELRALPDARRRATEAARTVGSHKHTLDVARRDLHEKQTLHNQAQEAVTQLTAKQKQRDELSERQGVFQELAEAFGKKGVQAMLIETAIPEIEEEANRLLGRMTDNQMHLTFEMQREKKQGGGAIETLDIKIADALGTRVYDAFSGGEAMRVNFAIRVALSRLLARRAGASLETLVIDEGFGTLDAQGRERFVEAITSVQHDFKRILVITHLDELKERFPAQIEITKTAQGSGWTLV
jgi:DNA repair protein SbcC/Rad50